MSGCESEAVKPDNKNRYEDLKVALLFACGFFGFFLVLALPVLLYAPNRPFTVPFRALSLWIFILFIWRCFARPRSMYAGPLLYCYLVWAVIYAWRLFVYSQEATYTLRGQYDYLMMGLGMCLIPGLAFFHTWDRNNLKVAHRTLATVGSLAGWMYCWIYRDGIATVGTGRMRGGEFIGDFVAINPLQVGYLGSALLILCYGTLKAKMNAWYKALSLVLMLVPGVLLIVFSNSRGPLVTLIICSIIYLCASVKRGQLLQLLLSFIAILLVGSGVIWYAVATQSILLERFVDTYYGFSEGGVHMSRLELIDLAIQQANTAPLFGEFVEIREVTHYPHNIFVEAYLATGLVGCVFFIPLICGTLFIAFKLMRARTEYAWISLLFFHYFIYVMFSTAIYSNSYFWCSLGLVLGAWQSLKLRTLA